MYKIRITSPEHCEAVLTKLFSQKNKLTWRDGSQNILHTDTNWVMIEAYWEGIITTCDDIKLGQEHPVKELTIEELK